MTAEPDVSSAPSVEPVDLCPLCGGGERHELLPAAGGVGVVRCRGCGLVHATGVYTASSLGDSDSRDASRREPEPAVRDVRRKRRAVQLYDRLSGFRIGSPPAGARALDIGCDTGLLLDVLRDLGYRTEGIERSPAAAQAEAAGHDVHALDIEVTELGLGRYELITLTHVLDQLREPVRGLRWIRRHLAPGGLAVIEVPNWGDLLRPLWGRRFRPLGLGDHVSFFERATLTNALQRAGLEVEIVWSAPQFGTGIAPSLLTAADLARELRGRLRRQGSAAGPHSRAARQGRGWLNFAASRVIRALDRLDDLLGPWLEGAFGPACPWGASLVAVVRAPG